MYRYPEKVAKLEVDEKRLEMALKVVRRNLKWHRTLGQVKTQPVPPVNPDDWNPIVLPNFWPDGYSESVPSQ